MLSYLDAQDTTPLTRKFRAFTLIEVVVTLVVIAVLTVALVNNGQNQQARARDTARLADMELIKHALNVYKMDNGAYPISPLEYDPWGKTSQRLVANTTMSSDILLLAANEPLPPIGVGASIFDIEPILKTYMREIPTDPIQGLKATAGGECYGDTKNKHFAYYTYNAGEGFYITSLKESKKGNTNNCGGVVDANKNGSYEVIGDVLIEGTGINYVFASPPQWTGEKLCINGTLTLGGDLSCLRDGEVVDNSHCLSMVKIPTFGTCNDVERVPVAGVCEKDPNYSSRALQTNTRECIKHIEDGTTEPEDNSVCEAILGPKDDERFQCMGRQCSDIEDEEFACKKRNMYGNSVSVPAAECEALDLEITTELEAECIDETYHRSTSDWGECSDPIGECSGTPEPIELGGPIDRHGLPFEWDELGVYNTNKNKVSDCLEAGGNYGGFLGGTNLPHCRVDPGNLSVGATYYWIHNGERHRGELKAPGGLFGGGSHYINTLEGPLEGIDSPKMDREGLEFNRATVGAVYHPNKTRMSGGTCNLYQLELYNYCRVTGPNYQNFNYYYYVGYDGHRYHGVWDASGPIIYGTKLGKTKGAAMRIPEACSTYESQALCSDVIGCDWDIIEPSQQTRTVECLNSSGEPVDEEFCNTAEKPTDSQSCEVGEEPEEPTTYHWELDGHEEQCDSSGNRPPIFSCVDNNDNVVNGGLCSHLPYPTTPPEACSYTRKSTVSSCNRGRKTTSYTCKDQYNKNANEGFCSQPKPSTPKEACHADVLERGQNPQYVLHIYPEKHGPSTHTLESTQCAIKTNRPPGTYSNCTGYFGDTTHSCGPITLKYPPQCN